MRSHPPLTAVAVALILYWMLQVEAPQAEAVLAHGVLAFVFNVVVVALTIDVVAGLI